VRGGLRARVFFSGLCGCAAPEAPTPEAPVEDFVPAQAPAFAAPQTPSEPLPPALEGNLERQLGALAARSAAGFARASRLAVVHLHANDARSFALTVRPGRCYRILGASQRGVADVDASVFSEAQVALEDDLSYGPQPTLGVRQRLCATHAAVWRVELRMMYSHGWTALRAYSTPDPGLLNAPPGFVE
jgi:hypothetical protein